MRQYGVVQLKLTHERSRLAEKYHTKKLDYFKKENQKTSNEKEQKANI